MQSALSGPSESFGKANPNSEGFWSYLSRSLSHSSFNFTSCCLSMGSEPGACRDRNPPASDGSIASTACCVEKAEQTKESCLEGDMWKSPIINSEHYSPLSHYATRLEQDTTWTLRMRDYALLARYFDSPNLDFCAIDALLLGALEDWRWDCWALDHATGGHALSFLMLHLITSSGICERLNLDKEALVRYSAYIEQGYVPNPYHNASHAASVLQRVHLILQQGGLLRPEQQRLQKHLIALPLRPAPPSFAFSESPVDSCTDWEVLAVYVAAAVHDFAHVGRTNDFLIATKDPIALEFKNRSPLENLHLAESLGALRQQPGLNFMHGASVQDQLFFRCLIAQLVMATDMKAHQTVLDQFRTVFLDQDQASTWSSSDGCRSDPSEMGSDGDTSASAATTLSGFKVIANRHLPGGSSLPSADSTGKRSESGDEDSVRMAGLLVQAAPMAESISVDRAEPECRAEPAPFLCFPPEKKEAFGPYRFDSCSEGYRLLEARCRDALAPQFADLYAAILRELETAKSPRDARADPRGDLELELRRRQPFTPDERTPPPTDLCREKGPEVSRLGSLPASGYSDGSLRPHSLVFPHDNLGSDRGKHTGQTRASTIRSVRRFDNDESHAAELSNLVDLDLDDVGDEVRPTSEAGAILSDSTDPNAISEAESEANPVTVAEVLASLRALADMGIVPSVSPPLSELAGIRKPFSSTPSRANPGRSPRSVPLSQVSFTGSFHSASSCFLELEAPVTPLGSLAAAASAAAAAVAAARGRWSTEAVLPGQCDTGAGRGSLAPATTGSATSLLTTPVYFSIDQPFPPHKQLLCSSESGARRFSLGASREAVRPLSPSSAPCLSSLVHPGSLPTPPLAPSTLASQGRPRNNGNPHQSCAGAILYLSPSHRLPNRRLAFGAGAGPVAEATELPADAPGVPHYPGASATAVESAGVEAPASPCTGVLRPLEVLLGTASYESPRQRVMKLLLQVVLKSADLGHVSMPLPQHKRWLVGLEEEMFRQGDCEHELGLPISIFSDRRKIGISGVQVGFFVNMVMPLYQALAKVLPGIQTMVQMLEENLCHWRRVEDAKNAVAAAALASSST